MRVIDSSNALWVHMVVFHPDYELTFLSPILTYLFTEKTRMEYVVFVVPASETLPEWLESSCMKVMPSGKKHVSVK